MQGAATIRLTMATMASVKMCMVDEYPSSKPARCIKVIHTEKVINLLGLIEVMAAYQRFVGT